MVLTMCTALYQTSDKTSFAYISARDRWPVILVSEYWIVPSLPCYEIYPHCFWSAVYLVSSMHSTRREPREKGTVVDEPLDSNITRSDFCSPLIPWRIRLKATSNHLLLTNASKTGAIDDLHKAIGKTEDSEKQTEGKNIVSELAKLKYELQHDRQLTCVYFSTLLMFTDTDILQALSPMMDKATSRATTRS